MGRPSNIIIAAIKRNQRFRGPSSSEQQNDFQAEVIRDLTSIQQEWNNKLVPLTAKLPDGSVDSTVNAFTNGLDGQTLFVNADATSSLSASRYYNTTKDRPNTLFEQFVNLFTYVDDQITALESAIEAGASSGALTASQKSRIGSNIFDNAVASLSNSLDGRTQIQAGNILQLARDLYGTTSPTLNSNGSALLSNSVRAMVDALLELHGGNWTDDIALTHSAVSASDITTGTLAQQIVGPSSAAPAGINDAYSGTPSNIVEDLNILRTQLRNLKGTGAFTTTITPDGTWSGVLPVPNNFVGLLGLKGSGTRSTENPWGYLYTDLSDLVSVLEASRDFVGQSTVGDSTPTYGALNGFVQGDPLNIAIGALASGINSINSDVLTVSGELNVHILDSGNPHNVDLTQVSAAGGTAWASQINIVDAGARYVGTEVETALQEVANNVFTHSGNTSNPHNVSLTQVAAVGGTAAATLISVADTGAFFTTANTEDVLQEVGQQLEDMRLSPRFTTSGLTLTAADSALFVDASTGNLNILLPSPGTFPAGKLLAVKKIDASTNTITLSGVSSSSIDGSLQYILSNEDEGILLQPTDSGYFILANHSLGEERVAVKPSDTIRDNTAILTADPHLQLSVLSGVYLVNSTLRATVASDNPGLRLDYTTASEGGISNMSTVLTRYQPTGDVVRVFDDGLHTASGVGSGTEYAVELRGTIEFSTPEVFTVKWAQETSHADDVTMKRGSSITLKKIR